MKKTQGPHKSGFVAIVGAPNAGKSTLLNRLLDSKVAITAARPQTTRRRILGVLTAEGAQIVFWDTPGYHASEKMLNQEMVARTLAALGDADVCLWLADGVRRGAEHEAAKGLARGLPEGKRLLIAVSKADIADRAELKSLKEGLAAEFPGVRVLTVSAKSGSGLGELKGALIGLLPEGPPFYPEDALTDQPLRLMAAEFVREAVFRLTSQEIPYSTAVTIDEYIEPAEPAEGAAAEKTYISATIHVERANQAGIMIGRRGQMIQNIGKTARASIEKLIGGPVYLKLFVRTTKDWSRDKRAISDYVYGE
jgi:GTP-binding protein Era